MLRILLSPLGLMLLLLALLKHELHHPTPHVHERDPGAPSRILVVDAVVAATTTPGDGWVVPPPAEGRSSASVGAVLIHDRNGVQLYP